MGATIKGISPQRKPPAWRNHDESVGDFAGKIDRPCLPLFIDCRIIQVTGGPATDPRWDKSIPQRDQEWTREPDCGGLRKIICGVERAGEKKPRLYCTLIALCATYIVSSGKF